MFTTALLEQQPPVFQRAGRQGVCLQDNRAPTVQRKPAANSAVLKSGGVIQRVINYQQNRIPVGIRNSLIAEIIAFNTYDKQKKNSKKALHAQFKMIDDIEKRINVYLSAQGNNVSDPDRTQLFGILHQAEKEHVKLTARLNAHGHDMWLDDPHMSPRTARQTQALWHSLRTNSGNIKVDQRDHAFVNQTMSAYVRMLRGNHGRGLLRELNKPQLTPLNAPNPDKEVWIAPSYKTEFRNYGKRGEANPGSFAMPMDYIRHNTHNELNGVGTGSYVQIQHEGLPGNKEDYESGEQGQPIFAPKFITLGHELGHARHNLRGKTKQNSWYGVHANNPLDTHDDEQGRWSNPEEHHNITHEENQMRLEHNLPKRKYHATIKSGRSTANRINMDKQLDAMGKRVPKHLMKYIGPRFLSPLLTRLQNTDLSNRQAAAALQRDVDAVQYWLTYYINKARLQDMKNNPKSYAPSKKQMAVGALSLVGSGLGLAYGKGWFGSQ
jgi:hypothetical protein